MTTNKRGGRVLAMLLTFVLLVSLCPLTPAADNTVRIGSEGELKAFAEKCASDRYSDGLTALLTADIDLGGTEVSIPIFLGTFDGNGHRITGLKATSENGRLALFGRIEKGGVVKDLQLEGEVSPAGTQDHVGGLAGENAGRIENCRFSGVVVGTEAVGGLVGVNEADGTISGSSAAGVVRGKRLTGGIVGENAGSVVRCANEAAVNTTVSEEDLAAAELEALDSAVYDLLKNRDHDHDVAVTTDTGGVAGHSTGVLQSCENRGTIGYPHVGYNVGGIVGRQSGYISNCQNHGEILGRKDVGGIVGQMTPDITLQSAAGGLDELQTELNTLQALIDRTLGDADTASSTLSGQLDQISGYAASARENAGALTGQLGDFVDNNVAAVNGTALLIERYLAKLSPIADNLADAAAGATDTLGEVRALVAILNETTGYNEQFLLDLKDVCAETTQGTNDLRDGVDALERAFALLGSDRTHPDMSQLTADLDTLATATGTLNEITSQALAELETNGFISEETGRALAEAVRDVLDARAAVERDLADILQNTDFSGLIDQDIETLRQFAREMQTAAGAFSSAATHMQAALDALGRGMDTLRNLNTQFSEAAAQLDTTLATAKRISASLEQALRKTTQWADDLAAEEPPTFSPLGTDFRDSSDALNASLGGIGNTLSSLNASLSTSGATLLSDLRAINDQFMKVMNLFLNLVHETQNVDYSDVIEDVSEESLQSAVQGKVQECLNDGVVEADRNVGGVVGSMAVEYDFDPEDDLVPDDRSGRFTYQTRAILLNCQNSGAVSAKRSCAGSVVGRMDIGTVSGCGGFGDVTSESGDYIGGVCGFSLSPIKNSFAKCTLSGGKYVGGIVGSGKRVSDCAAMVEITSDSPLRGAIAGEITGEYTGNRFVSDTLAGVDRISLAGRAEPITYADLLTLDKLPDEMRHLTLRFVADDTELKRLTFDYGDSFPADVAPEIPPKDGNYAAWDKTDFANLRFDTTVTAVYTPYVTTVAGQYSRQNGRPVFLIEGDFDATAAMDAEEEILKGDELPAAARWLSREALESWTLTLPADGAETHRVHYLAPDGATENLRVFVKQDGAWQETDTTAFGSYLVTELSGTQATIAVVREKVFWWVWAAPVLALLLVVGVILLIARHHVRRKRRKKA